MNDDLFNYNDAEKNRDLTPVPPGVYRLRTKVRPFGGDLNNPLRPAKSGYTEMLELGFTVVGDKNGGREHDGHWFSDYITLVFTDGDPNDIDKPPAPPIQAEKYRTAVRIGRAKLRAILESAYAIDPNDDSDGANAKRKIKSFGDLDGLEFWGRVGIRPGNDQYGERNDLKYVVTPNLPDYPRERTQRGIVLRSKDLDDGIPF
jgi:hypothetical protein